MPENVPQLWHNKIEAYIILKVFNIQVAPLLKKGLFLKILLIEEEAKLTNIDFKEN